MLAALGSLHPSLSWWAGAIPAPLASVPSSGHWVEEGFGDGSAALSSISALLLKTTRGLDQTSQQRLSLVWCQRDSSELGEQPCTAPLRWARVRGDRRCHPCADKSPIIVAVMRQGTGSETRSHCC